MHTGEFLCFLNNERKFSLRMTREKSFIHHKRHVTLANQLFKLRVSVCVVRVLILSIKCFGFEKHKNAPASSIGEIWGPIRDSSEDVLSVTMKTYNYLTDFFCRNEEVRVSQHAMARALLLLHGVQESDRSAEFHSERK